MDEDKGNWRGFALVALAIVVGAALIAVVADDEPTRSAATGDATSTSTTSTTRTSATSSTTSTTGTTGTTGATSTSTATSTTAAGPSRPILKLGSRGSDVTTLQQKLAAAGYSPGTADGVFGQSTANALVAFQKAKNLTADGVAGPSTWAALGG